MHGRFERRAAAFRTTRENRHREVAEDYVEMIADLIADVGEARLTDLADRLGVSHPTATKTVQRLQQEGLVQTRPYRALFLTEAGHALAEKSRRRHKVIQDFLLAIGVDDRTAELDSEGMEHYASESTIVALEALTRTLASASADVGPE